ncbi:transporter substrate-binding domain-containing protein [Parahaliea maris]|uniref:Transporter substrate-binding domain-containing protein n=1 Tax=Parahaliea maris TaxID=2716870 RepID=A0A5C8ZNE6_9GAMM|nr:HD domain-containing phosphohydrolase [Parahaliea maris]TXS88901.1 transporter substrate-binding domain-containing protein [Parahaliea maris]
MRVRIRIRLAVVAIFVFATLLTASVALGLQYYFSQALAKSAAANLYTTSTSAIAHQFNANLDRTTGVVRLLSGNALLLNRDARDRQLRIFRRVLETNNVLYGIYIGRGDGSFLELINLNYHRSARDKLLAVPTDRWVVVEVKGNTELRWRHFTYLNEQWEVRASRREATDYDVRHRDWYKQALASATSFVSAPYLFAQLGIPGQTTAARVLDSDTVVAIDRTLETVSDTLRQQDLPAGSELYVYDTSGTLIASSLAATDSLAALPLPEFKLTSAEKKLVSQLPVLRVSNEMDWPPIDYAVLGEPRGYAIDVISLLGRMTGLRFTFVNGMSWPSLVQEFRNGNIDVLHPIGITEQNREWGEIVDSFLELPLALVTGQGHPPVHALAEMAGKQVAIPRGWAVADTLRQYFPTIEIIETDSPADSLRRVLDGEVVATLDNEPILRYVQSHYFIPDLRYHTDLDFSGHSMPDDMQMLVQPGEVALARLLNRAIAAIGEAQRNALSRKWLDPDLASAGGISGGTVPHAQLATAAADESLQARLLPARYRGQAWFTYVEPLLQLQEGNWYLGFLVPKQAVLGPFNEKVLFSILLTSVLLLLIVPFSWLFASPIVEPVKQLALENDKVRQREFENVGRCESRIQEIDELSDSMVSMVQAIQAHEAAQRELMDAFIRLIAQAIDDKSPYTGGHCARVPDLALMLAKRASASRLPAFRDFELRDEEEWREFRIAAWLHDCGKITTPEHVVDKGSKLETIYNRIHEVRTRFEVLWRDAEIHYLKQCLASPGDEPSHRDQLERSRKTLQDDFCFVAECNVGGEFMTDDARERLRDIAATTWQRHFDNRAGLSPVEELRQPAGNEPLPATEALLADRHEHIIPRTQSTRYPPKLGIDMDIPEHLYNLGELYNLSISRGTLTAEDRFKINEHMISTIRMLESLPFPDELGNVPRYASTHHETMKGTGYPRRLPGSELSIPERLLAVADVFEALTAADRPYKKAKPVSVAVDILHKMVEDDHIDRDSFELFIRERVYLQYAGKFLPPEQIDKVDEAKYLT